MKNQNLISIGFLFLVILFIAGKEFLTITNIEVVKKPEVLFPDGNSTIIINVQGMNRFGYKVPFKEVKSQFRIVEGAEKVKIVNINQSSIKLRAKYETGTVVILIQNNYTIIPIEITIYITGNFV